MDKFTWEFGVTTQELLNIDKFDNSGTIIDNNKGVFLKERIPTYKPLITVVLLVQIRV